MDLPDLGNINAIVKAIFYQKRFIQSTNEIPENSTFGIILDRTSFYAEAGGQEYDTGNIVIDGLADFEVTNVQSYNGYVLHTGHLKYGQLTLQDSVISSYDEVSFSVSSFFFPAQVLTLLKKSSVVGPCGIIIVQPIFSTFACVKSLATI